MLLLDNNDGASETANTDVYAADIKAPVPAGKGGFIKLLVSVETGSILNVTLDGTDLTALNDNTALTADTLYEFNIPVKSGDLINFQFETTTVADIMSLYYFD